MKEIGAPYGADQVPVRITNGINGEVSREDLTHGVDHVQIGPKAERTVNHDLAQRLFWMRKEQLAEGDDANQATIVLDHESVSDECCLDQLA